MCDLWFGSEQGLAGLRDREVECLRDYYKSWSAGAMESKMKELSVHFGPEALEVLSEDFSKADSRTRSPVCGLKAEYV